MNNTVVHTKLSDLEEEVLSLIPTSSMHCVNYRYLESEVRTTVKELRKVIKVLKQRKYLEFYRGLMTEDGEVAGSGWCRSDLGDEYVDLYDL